MAGAAQAQPQKQLEPDSDEAGLAMQVAHAEDDVRTSAALVRDPALNAYVRGVMCRVAGAACGEFRLYIVEAPGLSVASMPNGALIVWTGALLRAENESQLAHLIAHEVAHYRHKDTLEQFHRMLNTSGVVALLGVAAAGAGFGFVGTPASLAALSADYQHSATQERDADRDGFAMTVTAGYDARAALTLWRGVNDELRVSGGRDLYSKLHPPPDDRIDKVEAMVAAAPRTLARADGYRAATKAWEERWIGDQLRRGVADENVALFTRLAAGDPRYGLYQYALGEAYRKRDQPGDQTLARASFQSAIACPDQPALAWRGLGLMEMQRGDKTGARAALVQYRAHVPDADDHAMIDYYLAQL
jgi:predicted Zn-dependent protease